LRTIDPSVLERIEVIKGATSIYGNGADGGLINYITKRPVAGKTFGGQTIVGLNTNVVEARNSVGYRATQQFYGKLKAFDYVVSGTFDQSGVYKDARGQVISPEYGLGETKSYNGFAKLGYDLNEKNRLELMYNYFGSRQNSDYVVQAGRYGESPAIGVRGERLGVDEGTRFNHNSYLTYRGQELLGGTSLEATLYYQNFRTIYSNAAGFFETDGQSQIDSDKKGLRFNLNTPFLKGEAFNADVTYGLDVLNDVTSQTLTDGRVWAPEMDMHNLAPYAQLRSTLFTYFVLKAGARVENIQIKVPDYTTIRTRSGSSIVGGVDVQGGTLKYDAAVYNAGLRYTRFKFFNPFLSYSEGFSLYELGRTLRASTAVNLDLLQTDPIIVRNREVGFNSQLGPVNLGGVYYVSKSDLGGNLVEQNGVLVLQRVPERVSGYELTLDVAALPNLSVGGSYSYVEGKATTQLDLDRDGVAETKRKVYLNGTRVQPPKATAYVRYSPIEALSLNLNWIYSGRRDRFDPLATPTATSTYRLGEGRIEAFDLFNLSAAYRVKPQVTVNLGVENLLNTAYYSPYAQLQGSSANYTRGNGARVNLSAGYSF
jgi:iron complex outermembrane receptor protein